MTDASLEAAPGPQSLLRGASPSPCLHLLPVCSRSRGACLPCWRCELGLCQGERLGPNSQGGSGKGLVEMGNVALLLPVVAGPGCLQVQCRGGKGAGMGWMSALLPPQPFWGWMGAVTLCLRGPAAVGSCSWQESITLSMFTFIPVCVPPLSPSNLLLPRLESLLALHPIP